MTDCLRAYERGVLRVTLNRPAKRNALSRAMLRELKAVFDAHAGLDDLRLAVLGGAGDVAFCFGADLADLAGARDEEATAEFVAAATAALDAVRRFPVPTVAVLNGAALGGGAELALACDMRLAAAHARVGYSHAEIHTATGWGGGPDLARLAGYAAAMELLASARALTADEARALGLVNHVAPAGVDLLELVERFLEPMRERPPHVMRALKAQALAERFGWPVEMRREAEHEHFVRTWLDPAHWTAVDDRFKSRED
ncbi:MAG: enoyl-CoA hydratase/isomerase family protein [Burkholderiales bacterium]